MSPVRETATPVEAIAGVSGGLVFAGSLLYFAYSYAIAFARPAGRWSLGAALAPVVIDAALFSAFALHHSVFARAGLKEAVARVLPPRLERTAYVWIASVLFVLTCWWWQPVPGTAWSVGMPWAVAFGLVQVAGIAMTLRAAARIDILQLSGVRQALALPAPPHRGLSSDGLYGVVRHPIYLAWLLLVWPAATMTGTRLAFAALSTAYLVVAIPFEERDLVATFGAEYRDYRRRVRWRLVPGIY
jgi:protein-S-isoprenylcysteine O-methyltransferase Ste14